MNALAIAIVAVAAIPLVPVLILLLQVLAAFLPGKEPADAKQSRTNQEREPAQVLLLMPAHNEASGITQILQGLLPQLRANERLLVVADNCSDATAAIVQRLALEYGSARVEVVERHNAQLRGKGYALDHGVRHVAKQPPDVVIIVDADCEVAAGALATLTRTCSESGRPVQGLYLMKEKTAGTARTRIAEFAWLLKNRIRPLGLHRLGLPCQLMGTGMAFTWKQISEANLHTGHIVEDMQLGIELCRSGTPPLFCQEALVTSTFPTSAEGASTQRTRWEHGHLSVMFEMVPGMLRDALRSGNRALFFMGLDLLVPPLALLGLVIGANILFTLAILAMTALVVPLLLATGAAALLLLATVLAWSGFGREVISFAQLCAVPFYMARKLPLYFFFLVRRQSSWVRSKRDGD
jgi:cellulose synthase/poly-beta-1,6-N-acetylglucosamine synthase-like glycosyltransferase